MLVVIVGVVLILLMALFITQVFTPAGVAQAIEGLAAAGTDAARQQESEALLRAFRRSVLTSVAVAALGAVIAGVASSLVLSREILRPLRDLADGSRRIAHGHYAERVEMPGSDELALVARNFNQMAEALQQVEQQRVTLIANVSHELRTPLTGLTGYLEGLMDGVFPGNEETFAQLYQEVRRLSRLVDDLQDLSRVEAGQIALQIERFDLIPLVERVVNQAMPLAEAGSLSLALVEPPKRLEVIADPDRTAQVLLNLLSNAVRYTPPGGHVELRVAQTGLEVRVTVRDTGIGIPTEALPYLFERFYRVDNSRARRSGGSGIGLTIARHLAWAMGGELTAASPGAGQGSTFTFVLPAAEPRLPQRGMRNAERGMHNTA